MPPTYEPSEIPPPDAVTAGQGEREAAAELLTLTWEFITHASPAACDELRAFLTSRGSHPATALSARMAWRRHDYRQAQRASATAVRQEPMALPAGSGPQPPAVTLTTANPPRSPNGHDSWHTNPRGTGNWQEKTTPQPTSQTPREETQRRHGDPRPLPLPPGDGGKPTSRPRRPWDPPTPPGDHR